MRYWQIVFRLAQPLKYLVVSFLYVVVPLQHVLNKGIVLPRLETLQFVNSIRLDQVTLPTAVNLFQFFQVSLVVTT